MYKKGKYVLYIVLSILIILFISIIIFVIYEKNKIVKYDEYKINEISNYLKVNSMFYDGIQENLKTINNSISIDEIGDIELNNQIASYVITNVVANSEYGYDQCNECYKYFSKYDNIRFYDVDSIEYIYNELFGKEIKKITQEDIINFNVLYYNGDIDMYYINVVYDNIKPKIISEFKEYSYEDDMLYLDYYYSNIVYDESDVDIKDNMEEKIYLYNIDNIMTVELLYEDLFNEDNIIIDYSDYVEYFDTIRYVFKYNNKLNKYILNEIKLLVD